MADGKKQNTGDRRQETGDRRQALTLPQTWRQVLITPSLSQHWEREGAWGWARAFPSAFCILSPVFLSLLLSCAGPRALKRHLPADTAADLLKVASEDVARLRTFEGEARISLRLEGVRQRGSALVLFRRPDDLKVDVTGPIGVRLVTAVASGDSLRVFLPRSNDLYEGRADGDALRRIIGVDLRAWTPWRAVLGVAPADSGQVEGFEREGDRLIVRLRETSGTRRLTFDARSLTLAREEVYDREGTLVARREMSGYREVDGVVLPRRIALFQGEDEVRVEYTDWRLNGEVTGERLRLRVPEGVKRVR